MLCDWVREGEPDPANSPSVLGCASRGTLAQGGSSCPAVRGFGAGRCVFGHVWKVKGLIPLLIMKFS